LKVFFDTSVLVAAFVSSHEHHTPARAAVQRVVAGRDDGVVGAHTLAEVYAVLTRLPVVPRIQPAEAARIVEDNVVKHFTVQTLNAAEHLALIRRAPALGIAGGAIYDALLLACAEKAAVSRIYTFNTADFSRLAPALSNIVTSP